MSNGLPQRPTVVAALTTTPGRLWHGWAVDIPGRALYVQHGGDEDQAWIFALGWPSPGEVVWWKHKGARAFPILIIEEAPL